MSRFLSFLLRRHPIASGLLVLAVAVLVIFAWQFAAQAIYFNDPTHQNPALELWMSPRYVGRSWDLPPPVVFDIMQMDHDTPPHDGPRTLTEVLSRTGLTLEELQARVESAKTALEARRR